MLLSKGGPVLLQRSRLQLSRLVNTKKASDVCTKTIFIYYHLLGFYCSVYVNSPFLLLLLILHLLLFIINFAMLLYCIVAPCCCARGCVFDVFGGVCSLATEWCTLHTSNKRQTAAPKKRRSCFVNGKLLNLKQSACAIQTEGT